MSELRPCPFCGEEDIYIVESPQEVALGCNNCRIPEVLIQGEQHQIAKGMAINIWNRRTPSEDGKGEG